MSSYNWSHIDEGAMKKADPEKYRLWRLTQMINYGRDGEKLDREEVKAAWPQIRDEIEDPYKRRVLEFILWGKLYSLPINETSWNTPRQIQK